MNPLEEAIEITRGPKHYGKFQFWPEVYELWWKNSFGGNLYDFSSWRQAPESFEVDYYCSRRQ